MAKFISTFREDLESCNAKKIYGFCRKDLQKDQTNFKIKSNVQLEMADLQFRENLIFAKIVGVFSF